MTPLQLALFERAITHEQRILIVTVRHEVASSPICTPR